VEKLKKVVIVGRTNVGKSTLFNRLVGARKAIVADIEGVTRDRLEAEVNWLGKGFILVDCGGIPHPVEEAREGATEQVWKAVSDADLVLLLVDAHSGVIAGEPEIARALRKQGKPTALVVNKVDHPRHSGAGNQFACLGIPDVVEVSAVSGRGTGDLMDYIAARVGTPVVAGGQPTRVAIVGRRNVGKSTLVNRLLGEGRVVVSDKPGTTRDAVEVSFSYGGEEYILVDTAGLVLRRREMESIAYYSEMRALDAIEKADVVLFMLDAQDGILRTDKRIGGRIKDAGKATVIVSNKWDTALRGKDERTLRGQFEDLVRKEMGFLKYAPVVFVSALDGTGLESIFGAVRAVGSWRRMWIPQEELTQIVRGVGESYPNIAGKSIMRFGRQSGIDPTRLHIYVRNAEKVNRSLSQILEDEIRSFYPYAGVPIFFKFIEDKKHRAGGRGKTAKTNRLNRRNQKWKK
jgi:GTP-binding protein